MVKCSSQRGCWERLSDLSICAFVCVRPLVSRLIIHEAAAWIILDICLLEAVALAQLVHLVGALFGAVVIYCHGDGVDLRPAQTGRGSLARAIPDPVGEAVHFFLELEGGLLQWREEVPGLQAKGPALAQEGAAAGAVKRETSPVVPTAVSPGPLWRVWPRTPNGRAPPLVVEPPQDSPPLVALAAEEACEGPLELLAGAWIDDRVDAAVEVT